MTRSLRDLQAEAIREVLKDVDPDRLLDVINNMRQHLKDQAAKIGVSASFLQFAMNARLLCEQAEQVPRLVQRAASARVALQRALDAFSDSVELSDAAASGFELGCMLMELSMDAGFAEAVNKHVAFRASRDDGQRERAVRALRSYRTQVEAAASLNISPRQLRNLVPKPQRDSIIKEKRKP